MNLTFSFCKCLWDSRGKKKKKKPMQERFGQPPSHTHTHTESGIATPSHWQQQHKQQTLLLYLFSQQNEQLKITRTEKQFHCDNRITRGPLLGAAGHSMGCCTVPGNTGAMPCHSQWNKSTCMTFWLRTIESFHAAKRCRKWWLHV